MAGSHTNEKMKLEQFFFEINQFFCSNNYENANIVNTMKFQILISTLFWVEEWGPFGILVINFFRKRFVFHINLTLSEKYLQITPVNLKLLR